MSRYWAVVPAAGIGARMQAERPKQYLHVLNKPILLHTLERLSSVSRIHAIVVCIATTDVYWQTLKLPQSVRTAPGGAERCVSVLNALQSLDNEAQPDDWILVHDAARPCVRIEDIDKLIDSLTESSVGGLLAMPVRDTLKRANNNLYIDDTVSRLQLWHALTPQMFRFALLKQALTQVMTDNVVITDDAQALEYLGYQPLLVEGHADNIKITHPHDLKLAQLYLQQQLFG
jgi:2-C-methyl-D-erythritol 4-phosphate cytidylyltransferase